jgi:hypothetical protein
VVAANTDASRGFYSLLRWRTDSIRDEARNVAVIVVEERGAASGFKPAPVSAISSRLHEQGLLDAALQGLEHQVVRSQAFTLERLTALQAQLDSSLVLTEPKPVALTQDVETATSALYRALVAPRGGGSSRLTKSVVLDKVVNGLRRRGIDVRRGAYLEDFIFDAVLETDRGRRVMEVLSFAAPRKDWAPIERDAGHFLFAKQELSLPASAVVAPPKEDAATNANEHYTKVRRWLDAHDVRVATPEELADGTVSFEDLVGV